MIIYILLFILLFFDYYQLMIYDVIDMIIIIYFNLTIN